MRRFLLWALVVILLAVGLILLRSFLMRRQTTREGAAPAPSAVQLVFAAGGAPSEIAVWKWLLSDYRAQNPRVSVKLRELPANSDQQHTYYATLLGSGQPDVDVMRLDVIWVPEFVAAGWLAPLDDSLLETADFLPFASAVDAYDGVWQAVPWNVDVGLLYYRQDLLPKAGIAKPPETWSELREDILKIRRLAEAPREGFVWQGKQYEGLACVYLEQVASRGGSLDPRHAFSRQAHLEALRYLRMLIKQGLSPANTPGEMDEERAREMFESGDAVFMRNWPYAWSLLNAADSPVAGKVGIAPLPHGEGGVSAGAMGGWHLALPAGSAHRLEAQRLVAFLASPRVQKQLAARLNWLPTRRRVWADASLADSAPQVRALREVAATASPRPAIADYPALSLAVQEIVNSVLIGRLSPEEATDRLEAKLAEFR